MPPPEFLTFLARWPSGKSAGVVPFAARGK
jgi:hypothetical protein